MKISNFLSVPAKYTRPQQEGIDWLASAHALAAAAEEGPQFDREAYRKRIKRILSRIDANVGFRSSEVVDFSVADWDQMQIFDLKNHPQGVGATRRMQTFSESLDRVFEVMYPEEASCPEGILHVTCTGYLSPSAAQRIVTKRGWTRSTSVTHAYHMGCGAAFPALRIALGFKQRTDIVHTEMCTLHLNPTERELEQLVAQLLFSDGFIRYTTVPLSDPAPGLEILGLHEEIVPDSASALTWMISDLGMKMSLSREIPTLIERTIEDVLKRAFDAIGLDFGELRDQLVFAIHPGGPQIIDHIQKRLELEETQVRWSREVLFERGNMSSATLPHVWKKIVDASEVSPGELVVSLGFGPGLTTYVGIFRKSGSKSRTGS